MANSSFAAVVLMMLVVAVAVFLLTPYERRSTASLSNPASLWTLRR